MPIRFSPRPVFLLSLCLVAAFACKKGSSPSTGSADLPPAVTAIGTPVGTPVSKSIDASGGSLTSPDGKLDLSIPAGALPATTAISIQPVTNTAPGGVGLAYQLLPEGTKFIKPVTITFHYTDADAHGSLPYFLYIAFQDSALSWEADLRQRNLDSVAKTVSVTSMHFSIWSAFVDIQLNSGQDEYRDGQSNYLEVVEVLKHGTKPADGTGDDALLYSLPVTQNIPDNLINNWSLNGQGPNTLSNGNISGSGDHVTYNAPALIENETTVQVSVDVNFKETIYNYSNGKVVATFNKLALFHSIKLLTKVLNYTLKVELGDSRSANSTDDYGYTYNQVATMDLKIDGDVVVVSNIVNSPPQFTTTAATTGEQCHIITITPDDIGELYITAGHGTADQKQGTFNVTLATAADHQIEYTFQCNCMNCGVQNAGGAPISEEEFDTPDFTMTDSPQSPPPIGSADQYKKYTITPK